MDRLILRVMGFLEGIIAWETRFFRKLSRINATIDEPTAIEIARAECERRGWGWAEPVIVTEGVAQFDIVTNTLMTGGNVRMSISVTDGKVLSAGFNPR